MSSDGRIRTRTFTARAGRQPLCAIMRTASLLSLGLLCSLHLAAQGNSSASLQGTVTDSAGAVVPNASIQIKNVDTSQTQQRPTDGQGRYQIADLPVGNYEAQASAAGFQTVLHRGITLTVGQQAVVDFTLNVG